MNQIAHAKDYDYEDKKDDGAEDSPGGDMVEGKGQVLRVEAEERPLFDIPENMTEAEWRQQQYEEFQKKQYNEWQKQQFVEYEKRRFAEWQMRRWQQSQMERAAQVQAQHNEFVGQAAKEMQKEQEKHHSWLQSLLNNPKERKELMKEIEDEENKEL